MTRYKRYRRQIFIFVLFALLSAIVVGFVLPKLSDSKPSIAVVVKSTQTSFWQSVRAGVNAAAREYNLDVTFTGPASEDDSDMQNQIIHQAVDDGVDAIVLSAIDYYTCAEEVDRAAKNGVKIVVIDSDVASQQVSVRIGTDNYEAGRQAAQSLATRQETPLCVGVIGFHVRAKNGQERQNGFTTELKKIAGATVVETVNCASDENAVYEATIALLNRQPSINVIIAFNEIMTMGVSRAIAENGLEDNIQVIGFDNNTKSVNMLENGVIDTLIVQNPFAIGYMGVEKAQQLLQGKRIAETQITTEARAVQKETMFHRENEQLLFSFTESVVS